MIKKLYQIFDNYLLSRLLGKPSSAQYWYLPEHAAITSAESLQQYCQGSSKAPFYPVDYHEKLRYQLVNDNNIIVLPYQEPIGQQINPEAAFQYALALHDQYIRTQDQQILDAFFHYANYFVAQQSQEGYWCYQFDWFNSKAPWYSALAQARGACVMLRAWLHSNDSKYLDAITAAISPFFISTSEGGVLYPFAHGDFSYYEEYPDHPSGVINGFMACLISIWELDYWLKEDKYQQLWQQGIHSLEQMLPHYTLKWWSLYDLDAFGIIPNVNSPYYHRLELIYLTILSEISDSKVINKYRQLRIKQNNYLTKSIVVPLKVFKKVCYR